MPKSKGKSSADMEMEDRGRDNLGFEVTEPVTDIVKTRSKEDISTIKNNLAEAGEASGGKSKEKVHKKKKFRDRSAEGGRLENELFTEGEVVKSKRKSSKKKGSTKRRSKSQPAASEAAADPDAIAVVKVPSQGSLDQDTFEEEKNVIADKHAKRKRKSRSKDKQGSQTSLRSRGSTSGQQQQPEADQQHAEFVFGVFVHYSDCLKLDFHVLHPVVKVSLVNLANGKLIAKSDRKRKVSSYYEGDHVGHIVQLMTQPYDYKQKRSIIPRWEELLLFNEDPAYLSSLGADLGIFFEIVDFISMNSVNNEHRNTGWHHVAWAFLKPVPSKHYNNIEKRLRLQLYKAPKQSPSSSNEGGQEGDSLVWKWWSKCPHVPYPSSLYVTVEPVTPPDKAPPPAIRSMGPMQPEKGSADVIAFNSDTQLQNNNKGHALSQGGGVAPRVVLWTRLPGQTCKIPDQNLYEFSMNIKGAWCLRFSTDGRSLAVACPAPPKGSSVLVYSVETGVQEAELQGHKGPIYCLDWHRDQRLLSASGDGSIRIWGLQREEEAVLQHPTYVYVARFHPNSSDTVASAGYDQVVRIWRRSGPNAFIILHELLHHKAYINCLEFDIDGHVLFSGDQEGAIRVWETPGDGGQNWHLKKRLDFKELAGNAILSLNIHPGGRRLLVQCRSLAYPVIMVDLKLNTIMQTFMGSQSFRSHVSSCITPCGTYVLASSQDGAVYVWNADNGNQVHVYDKPLGLIAATNGVVVNCLNFSPTDHIIAFSGMTTAGLSSNPKNLFTSSVLVYKHKANSSTRLKNTAILPSIEHQQHPDLNVNNDQVINASEGQGELVPSKGPGGAGKSSEKFKSMLEQLDRMIVDKREEMSDDYAATYA